MSTTHNKYTFYCTCINTLIVGGKPNVNIDLARPTWYDVCYVDGLTGIATQGTECWMGDITWICSVVILALTPTHYHITPYHLLISILSPVYGITILFSSVPFTAYSITNIAVNVLKYV